MLALPFPPKNIQDCVSNENDACFFALSFDRPFSNVFGKFLVGKQVARKMNARGRDAQDKIR